MDNKEGVNFIKFREKSPLYFGRLFEGEVEGAYVELQVFSEPSHYGIAEGRISRLTVYPEKSSAFNCKLADYDRGWDGGKPPKDPRVRSIIEKTVYHFDQKNIDWEFEEKR
ncbi:DUF7678 domain-containing protein [Paenibacillus elgii]|uniref:DUF7678 domain-containing protein n=1 Tax=Paenibacillus elgii TaxID=189691 RepID=UPI001F231FC3|nr:hypothetical protein [Paenibacillus elgii]